MHSASSGNRPQTIDALRAHRRRQRERILKAAGWDDPSLVFPNHWGGPMGHAPSLRHIHATLLLLAGVSPKAVQDRLGHKTIQITMDLYSHVVPALQDLAAEAVDGLLNGPIGGDSEVVVTNS